MINLEICKKMEMNEKRNTLWTKKQPPNKKVASWNKFFLNQKQAAFLIVSLKMK